MQFLKNLVDENGIAWIIGQALGIVAIIFGFISYQLKTKRQLLFMQGVVATVFSIHYLLICAYPAMAMNIVSIFRNVAYDYRTERNIKSRLIPIVFVVIQALMCALTWSGWYSIFVLLGIGINTYCMSFENSQNVRKSILITSPLVLTYDVFAKSLGGTIYESVAVISAFIGILRNIKQKNNAQKEE